MDNKATIIAAALVLVTGCDSSHQTYTVPTPDPIRITYTEIDDSSAVGLSWVGIYIPTPTEDCPHGTWVSIEAGEPVDSWCAEESDHED